MTARLLSALVVSALVVSVSVLAGCAVTPINIPNSDSGVYENRDGSRGGMEAGAPGLDLADRRDVSTSKPDAPARDGFPTPGGDGLSHDGRGEGPRLDAVSRDGISLGKDAKPKTDKGKTGD